MNKAASSSSYARLSVSLTSSSAVAKRPRAAFGVPVRGSSRRNIARRFGIEKLELCGYPMVKKNEDMFILFDTMHERDGYIDMQTERHHNGIGRAYT